MEQEHDRNMPVPIPVQTTIRSLNWSAEETIQLLTLRFTNETTVNSFATQRSTQTHIEEIGSLLFRALNAEMGSRPTEAAMLNTTTGVVIDTFRRCWEGLLPLTSD
ncbi:hypothetical protein GN244_ATG00976 [Phytophthora infestans]|uniref:Uncharacterized protein n=1 Tax=Phytophthora infestans TaxID=4787 RepID=A0A833TTR0_PHYIN|nr:hypothetical protein GN244_ATG00976 [Phytophthora infestans]